MSRSKLTQAPISLITSGPRRTPELFAQLGQLFNLARSSAPDPKATLDAAKCPTCGADVEWAETVKYGAVQSNGKPEQLRYAYARCKANGAAHRWGFKAANPNAPAPSAKPPEARPTPPPAPSAVPPPPKSPPPSTHADNPFAAFETWLEGRIGARLDSAEAAIKDLAGKVTPDTRAIVEAIKGEVKAMIDGASRNVTITIPTMPEVRFKGRVHPVVPTLLKYIAAGERFFFLSGPAATGKSTAARQVAEALQRPFGALAVTETMMREDILGALVHNLMKGEAHYQPTPFVEAWLAGGVCLLDECDRGNANTLTAINCIEQDTLYIPRPEAEGGPIAGSGGKAIVIATANTFGTGGNRLYVGANQLDGAFSDRFRTIRVGYDQDTEIVIAGGDDIAAECVTYFKGARERAGAASVRRPMTTRMIRRAATDRRLVTALGCRDAFAQGATEAGWTDTEIATAFPD